MTSTRRAPTETNTNRTVQSPAAYLTIVTASSRVMVKTLELRGVPRKIAFTENGDHAIVANEAGWVDFIK